MNKQLADFGVAAQPKFTQARITRHQPPTDLGAYKPPVDLELNE